MFSEQISTEVILFFMLYGSSALASLIASIYLLVRKGNAFSSDITPPMRLRRWAAALFAVAFLAHIWWYLFYVFSNDTHSVSCLVAIMLDCVGLLTTITGTLFAMLQDRKRTVWPFVIATIPCAVLMAFHIGSPDDDFHYITIAYFLLVYLCFTVYMVFAVRQYGRWLRDNYADLEHKEVWVSHALIIVLLLLIITYGFDSGDLTISFLVQAIDLVLICFLLWRVETLPELENPVEEEVCTASVRGASRISKQQLVIPSNIEQLLTERCVGTQLYLQNDLSLHQLAQTIGINRFYLSKYFASQGITYNVYINNLRIDYFTGLYHEAVAAKRSFTALQLANESGFSSYSTFSLAFKNRMGQTVTAWISKQTTE